MQMDDMILVSIDDHMIEPPDMYENHVPAKWQRPGAQGRPQRRTGVDEWVFQGEATSTPFGMAATVGWPTEEWGFNPGSYSELRPGLLRRARAGARHGRQRRARVDELPDHGRLQRPHLHRGRRQGARPRHAPGLQRLGHRRVVRHLPGPLHPARASSRCGTSTSRSRRSTASARRAAARSASSRRRTCRASRASCPATGTRCSQALCDENMVLSLHIGAGFEVIKRPPEAPVDHLMVLACQISAITAQDLLFGPTLREVPRPARSRCPRAGSAGSPSTSTASTATSRTRRGCTAATTSAASCPPRCSASTSSPATSPTRRACCCGTGSASTSSPGSATTPTPTPRGPSRPSSPGASSRTRAARDEEIHKITWENACRFFDWDPFAAHRRRSTPRSARCAPAPTDVDVTRMPQAGVEAAQRGRRHRRLLDARARSGPGIPFPGQVRWRGVDGAPPPPRLPVGAVTPPWSGALGRDRRPIGQLRADRRGSPVGAHARRAVQQGRTAVSASWPRPSPRSGSQVLIWDRPNTRRVRRVLRRRRRSPRCRPTRSPGCCATSTSARPSSPAARAASRVSLLTAARHPDVAAGARGVVDQRRRPRPAPLGVPLLQRSIRAAWHGGMEAVVELPEWQEVLERNPGNRDRFLAMDPQDVHRHDGAVDARVLPVRRRGRARAVGDDVGAASTVPTLVFRSGASDMYHTRATSEALAAGLPGAELVEPPWGDHEWNDRQAAAGAGRREPVRPLAPPRPPAPGVVRGAQRRADDGAGGAVVSSSWSTRTWPLTSV